jgi:hypothetical protein
MDIFENWGKHKLIYFCKIHKSNKREYGSIYELFNSRKIYYFSILSFLIGVIMTIPIIYVEVEYQLFDINQINSSLIVAYLFIFMLFVFLEFYLLFILGFYLLSYQIHYVLRIYNKHP